MYLLYYYCTILPSEKNEREKASEAVQQKALVKADCVYTISLKMLNEYLSSVEDKRVNTFFNYYFFPLKNVHAIYLFF